MIPSPATINWRSIPGKLALVVVLLVVLRVIVLPSPRRLEPEGTICHLMGQADPTKTVGRIQGCWKRGDMKSLMGVSNLVKGEGFFDVFVRS